MQSLKVGPPKVANEISMGVPTLRYVHLNGRYGSVCFALRFRPRASTCPLLFFFSFRRKKKCIRYIQGEGSCASPPSSDGSLLESPPSSPFMVSPSPSSKESKAQTEQMQPLSLTMKPPPLLSSSQHQHLSMASASTFSSVGQLRDGQNVRLGTQRLLGPLRRVFVPTHRLRLLQAHIGVSFPLSATQLCHDATPFARNQVDRLASLFFKPAFSLSVCLFVCRTSCLFILRSDSLVFFCAIWLWKFR